MEALEAESWSPPNRASRIKLAAALAETSLSSFVFVAQSNEVPSAGLLGAIFTQVIGSVDAIDEAASVDESEIIQDSNGRVLQLVRVNTLVTSGGENTRIGVGAALRDFALELAVELGLVHVCAVTRCTDFEARGRGLDFEEYSYTRTERGADSDAGLSFRLKRGAKVLKCVPGWRPGDAANQGYGVLVLYTTTASAFLKVRAA